MAEENNSAEKQFAIQKIYCKDVSFETPNSPQVFTEKWQPKVDFNLATNVEAVQDSLFEICITVTVTVKCNEQIAYLAEVKQAGIFVLKGFSDQEQGPMLGSYCPNVLFPYAREAISDLATKGGFPQLLLAPVNFDAIYAQHQEQQQKTVPGSNSVN